MVGAGPTGLELACALAQMARQALRRDFRNIVPARSRVVLVEASDRLLPSFAPSLSAYAARYLQHLGVELRLGTSVTDLGSDYVTVSGGESILASATL